MLCSADFYDALLLNCILGKMFLLLGFAKFRLYPQIYLLAIKRFNHQVLSDDVFYVVCFITQYTEDLMLISQFRSLY